MTKIASSCPRWRAARPARRAARRSRSCRWSCRARGRSASSSVVERHPEPSRRLARSRRRSPRERSSGVVGDLPVAIVPVRGHDDAVGERAADVDADAVPGHDRLPAARTEALPTSSQSWRGSPDREVVPRLVLGEAELLGEHRGAARARVLAQQELRLGELRRIGVQPVVDGLRRTLPVAGAELEVLAHRAEVLTARRAGPDPLAGVLGDVDAARGAGHEDRAAIDRAEALAVAERGRAVEPLRADRRPPRLGAGDVDGVAVEDHAVVALGRLAADLAVGDVPRDALGVAPERVAVAGGAVELHDDAVALRQRQLGLRVQARERAGLLLDLRAAARQPAGLEDLADRVAAEMQEVAAEPGLPAGERQRPGSRSGRPRSSPTSPSRPCAASSRRRGCCRPATAPARRCRGSRSGRARARCRPPRPPRRCRPTSRPSTRSRRCRCRRGTGRRRGSRRAAPGPRCPGSPRGACARRSPGRCRPAGATGRRPCRRARAGPPVRRGASCSSRRPRGRA